MKIIIFNKTSRAAQYGIGTYIDMLTDTLSTLHVDIFLINAFSSYKEVCVNKDKKYTCVEIPFIEPENETSKIRYINNIPFILKELISYKHDEKIIFHLNFMDNPTLVTCLRNVFSNCKILLVVHYTHWSFELLGNIHRLNNIINKPTRKRSSLEKEIIYSLKKEVSLMNKVDRIVYVAQHTTTIYSQIVKSHNFKHQVVHNAIKDEYIELKISDKVQLRKQYFISDDEQIILFVGRLDKVKGLEFLIKAFAVALKYNEKLHLLCIGDGDFTEWMQYAKQICTKISFIGKLQRNELMNFYRMADIGIIPSLHEEFGLVTLEMMMNKLPLIVTDQGGLTEIICHGENGLKVPVIYDDNGTYIDPNKLANTILDLAQNKDLRHKLGTNARLTYLSQYAGKDFSHRMEYIYNTI